MAQGALTTRIIPVHVLTASYRIAGTVKVSNYRVKWPIN